MWRDEETYLETLENWCGSYEIGSKKYLRIRLGITGPNPPRSGKWRVSVWGNDDFGMTKDFDNEENARACFKNLNCSVPISKIDLELNGFEVF